MDLVTNRPGPSVQEIFAHDKNPAPAAMLNESPAVGQSTADLPIERYFSKEWHDREVEKVWRKCWQLACRVEEIPNVGDNIVYNIVNDSLIVARTSITAVVPERVSQSAAVGPASFAVSRSPWMSIDSIPTTMR